jgi:hypothetical protein
MGFFFCAVGLFFFGVVWFRLQGKEPGSVQEGALESRFEQTPEGGEEAPRARSAEEVRLLDVEGGTSFALATRSVEEHVFYHTVVAFLPAPPEGEAYEGWLVREQPFDFFSTGALQPRADGTFSLTWQGKPGRDYLDYPKVVVTLEETLGDESPESHVLEGVFEF